MFAQGSDVTSRVGIQGKLVCERGGGGGEDGGGHTHIGTISGEHFDSKSLGTGQVGRLKTTRVLKAGVGSACWQLYPCQELSYSSR